MDSPPAPPRERGPAALRPGLSLSERVRFPAELPITASLTELANAIDEHQLVIVAGETGSGKTTQLPKLCLAMGRGQKGRIGCTQPRRLAATSIATRIAQELGGELGGEVGYKIRFGDRMRDSSRIKLMTDGILLAEIQSDPLLSAYDTLIIDEAHERSLNIDFLLGYLRRMAPRRPDLRIIISSATLEIDRFAKFFGGAPVIEVSGRTYPVDVLYRPPQEDEPDLADAVAGAVSEIAEMDPRNDILVFLPGEREIREALGELERRALRHTVILPLYARLGAGEQERVFQRTGQRRVVLATNVAETSLTIPGIVYVVDTGVARINRYNVRTGVSQLLVEPISRASADQRKGRCGRTESGVCFRLYEEQDYLSRPTHTDPEIRRVNLAGVILRMKALRLGEIEDFPFLDPPDRRAINEGYRVLEELGAIDEEGHLSKLGSELARLPIDPRLGRMILGGRDEGALREVVIIAAALGLQDVRDRPTAERQRADEAHQRWRDEGSDFASYLKLWAHWQDARDKTSRRQLQKQCREQFLSYPRLREWEDIHDQLVRILRELGFAPNPQPASAEQLHRALLPGLLSKIGMWSQETKLYIGARQTRFRVHPSSGLAKKPPQWVMAAELVETSQLFARTVAKIDPLWLERAAGSLCSRSYREPHWEQRQGQTMAKELVTLFGLPIVRDRRVPYARHDPALCRAMFITHALVRHEYTTKGRFQERNRALLEEVHQLRHKARKSDMLADEYELEQFFDRRLPESVVSGKTFEDWRRVAEAKDPTILELSRADLLLGEAHDLSPDRYPEQLVLGDVPLPLSYKFEPSEDDDGITVTVPLAVLPQLDPEVMAWTIPGWHLAKLEALLETLPKALRKLLAPLPALALELAARLVPFRGAFLPALERAILEHTGERIPRDAWDPRALPAYLSFTYRVVDERDKELGVGKDLTELQRTLAQRAKALWQLVPRAQHERSGLRSWDFGDLPASVTIEVAGRKVLAYPALVDAETAVDLRILESPAAAAAATREGLRRLYLLGLGTSLAKLEAQLPAALAHGSLATGPLPARRQLALRALDEAFRLHDPAHTPRSKASFQARLDEGRVALSSILVSLGRAGAEVAGELERARAALRPLTQRPGLARAVADDIESQLAHLLPPERLGTASLTRLGHLPRYLRAICVRLDRQAHDPQKDQQKAAQVVPLWQRYRARYQELAARGRGAEAEELGWLFEELRVQIFAPELKTAVPVSAQRVAELLAKL